MLTFSSPRRCLLNADCTLRVCDARLQTMIWPNSLVTCSMYSTLHRTTGDQGSLRFFLLVFVCVYLPPLAIQAAF